ncbi:hypothetical protein [Ruania halotolerans]|uniref:hypothetical protein n=1 Tax=Ruania halotolerans TaxID=2897773 RepID=UPI001E5EAA50|nr:hypothetical protein [Ruania halotolerans]UFU05232.1 hypothetical protein LQF10_12240 [Ruania halotolerans]
MSTRPGTESWRDAGVIAPEVDEAERVEPVVSEGPTDLVQEADEREPSDTGEDYHPHTPRPDLSGTADEADVADQAVVLPSDESDPDEEY